MISMEIKVRRVSVVSRRPFDEAVRRLTATVGRVEMGSFHEAMTSAKTIGDVEELVGGVVGPSELMEFVRFDSGEVLRKELGEKGPRILRLLIGNPIIMKEMARTVPDAAAYAPVTILVDERPDGVHLSYDSMASLLAPYGSPEALAVARDLDTKVESLLEAAAR